MPSLSIRPAAVAGLFYPEDAATLTAQIQSLLAHAAPVSELSAPKALIAPHAGYIYSGPVAANAYALLMPLRDAIRRVVLLGPSHRFAFAGIALPACNAFSTPLGQVDIDRNALFALAQHPEVIFDDRAHVQEHALEVQIPFLQSVLTHFTIVPLALGVVTPEVVAEVLEAVWGGPETLIIVSSDLSHYHPYALAQRDDRASVDRILALEPSLSHPQACGATAINALMLAARRHALQPHLLDLRNSGDTAGDRAHVVGYAAISFTPEHHLTH